MATHISFHSLAGGHPLADGVLTLARLERAGDGNPPVIEEYALEREALAEVQAALAAAGADPPPLVVARVAARLRAIGWRHLPSAA